MKFKHLIAFALLALASTSLADSINGFNGCSDDQKKQLNEAWIDAVRIAHRVWARFDDSRATDGERAMDQRFFGRYISDEQKRTIKQINFNISLWFPYWWSFREWLWGKKIQVSCIDLPNKRGTSCGTKVLGVNSTASRNVVAYVINENGPQIVFCSPFFQPDGLDSLENVANFLDDHPDHQGDPTWWRNQGAAFLHEMTHLNVIAHTDDVKGVSHHVDILDQFYDPVNKDGFRVYGVKLCEKWVTKYPQYAHLNADNYAWHATEYWYAQYYGVPGSTLPGQSTTQAPDIFVDDAGDQTLDGELADKSNTLTLAELDQITNDLKSLPKHELTYTTPISGKKLRILALGDSITNGFKSSSGEGYRGPLERALKDSSNTVELINEGHNGAVIDEISDFATNSLTKRPNVVLIHAGTNDLSKSVDPDNAPARLSALIDKVHKACPDASILVALIIASNSAAAKPRVPVYDAAVKDILTNKAGAGMHVDLVDMQNLLDASDMADPLHPNDSGYQKMADAWLASLRRVNGQGWIKDPVDPAKNKFACAKTPTWYPQGQIAGGAGFGQNAYGGIVCKDYLTLSGTGPKQCECIANKEIGAKSYVEFLVGESCEAMSYPLRNAVHFADLNGDGRAEYLWVGENGEVWAYLNSGPKEEGVNAGHVGWIPQGRIAGGIGGKRHEIHFADLNGDGRAEYIWVRSNGSIEVYLNGGGPDDGPNAAKIRWIPMGQLAGGIGFPGAAIRFADLNGDGRADYLALDPKGGITAYINGGFAFGGDVKKITWLPQGRIASGVGAERINVQFADMNGDGRADYLNVEFYNSGSVDLWQNQGGPGGANAGHVGWWHRGQITGGDGTPGSQVLFADLNGDGRAEYLEVDLGTSAVKAYLNGCPP